MRRPAHRPNRSPLALALFAGALLGIAAPQAAVGQDAGEGVPAGAWAAPFPDLGLTDERLRALTAESVIRLATVRARSIAQAQRSLTTRDYAVTALMLESARSVLGPRETLVRRELEAWSLAGAGVEVERLTRLLLELDPRDEVAQLRLILNRIDRMQTVEERLRVYERLVNEGSGAFSESLRSRLALDWAMLARETGDDRGFLEALTLATALDVTNKGAASLYATYVLPFAGSDLERVEILMNVVLSDPLDEGAVLALARELLRVGAFQGGRRFFDLALRLRLRAGFQTTEDENTLTLIAIWRTDGPNDMLERIAAQQAQFDALADQARDEREAEGFDVGAYEEPTLQSKVELLRLLTLMSMGDDAVGAAYAAVSSVERLERAGGLPTFEPVPALAARTEAYPPEVIRSYWRTIRSLEDEVESQISIREWAEGRAARPEFLSERFEDAIVRDRDRAVRATLETEGAARLTRIMTRLGVGFELEAAKEDLAVLESFEGAVALTPEALERIRAWIVALEGDWEAGVDRLTPLAEGGDELSWLALASANEVGGDTRAAALAYLRLAKAQPATGLGIYAESRASEMLGVQIAQSDAAFAIDEYAMRAMPWIESLVSDPQSSLRLSVEPSSLLVEPFELPSLRVVLRNTGQHPLALGESSPVNPRVLLTPSIVLGGLRYPADLIPVVRAEVISEARIRNIPITSAQADQLTERRLERLQNQLLEVVRFDSRLRLLPGEETSVVLDIAEVPLGSVGERAVGDRMRFRWRGSQGFVAAARSADDSGSTFVEGPQSVSAETGIVTRTAMPVPPDLEATTAALATAEGDMLIGVATDALAKLALEPIMDVSDELRVDAADEALAAAVGRMSRAAAEYLFVRLIEVSAFARMPKATRALADRIDAESSAPVLATVVTAPRELRPYIDRETAIGFAEATDNAALRDLALIISQARQAEVPTDDDFETIDETGDIERP